MAHEMYFVPGPKTFPWVKVMAKWYLEMALKPIESQSFQKLCLP